MEMRLERLLGSGHGGLHSLIWQTGHLLCARQGTRDMRMRKS